MSAAIPPSKYLLFGVLGIGAFWWMRQARAGHPPLVRTTVAPRVNGQSPDAGILGLFSGLARAGGSAAATAPNVRLPLNPNAPGPSSSAPGVPDEVARSAVRAGDSYYGAGNAGNSGDLGVPTDAARAAVRAGDTYYTSTADSVLGNPAPAIAYGGNDVLTNWSQGGDYGAFL